MKGFTLLELMVAVILLGIVVFAVNSAELNARRFLNIDLARSILIRDGSYVLDEIAKMVKMGSAVTAITNGVGITINDPMQGSMTVEYYKDESRRLNYNNPYLQILAGEPGSGVLIRNVENFEVSISGNLCTLTLTLWDSDWQTWDPEKQRQVTLSTCAQMQNVP